MKELFDQVALKCSKLTTNSYSTSFSLGIKFLDKSIHNEIYAIYGFVRFADEIVDSFHDYFKEELLEEFKLETWRAIERKISLNPILNSFQWVINKYDIDHELIKSFLESMSMDLKDQVYDKDLYEKYILGSAKVVGLMCLKVFVNGSQAKYDELKEPAMSLGSAFQKINFLRDLGQDSNELGRSYFPQLQNQNLDQATKEELIIEIKKDFEDARAGIQKLPKNSRFGVYVAYTYYLDLLKKISNSSIEKISQNRIRISNFKKIQLASKAFYECKLKLSVFTTALVLIFTFSCPAASADHLNAIRASYKSADSSKANSKDFSKSTKNSLKDSSSHGYHAASKMVQAKFGFNPITKLKLFKEGRNELEALIDKEPNNIELRYIRLTVQNAIPSFLSYKININEDKDLLIKHLQNSQSKGNFEDNLQRYMKTMGFIETGDLDA